MPTSHLLQLPSELINHVCHYLTSKHDLVQLARCSQLLYGIAQPHLFHDLDLLFERGQSSGYHNDGGTMFPLYPAPVDHYRHLVDLVDVLLRRPDLAQTVRHLRIRAVDPPDERLFYLGPLLPTIETAIKALPMDANFDRIHELMARPQSTYVSSEGAMAEDEFDDFEPVLDNNPADLEAKLFAILVASCTKLITLDFEHCDATHLRGLHSLVLHNNTNRAFDSIKSICFGASRCLRRAEFWRDIFAFPNVTHIYLHRVVTLPYVRRLGEKFPTSAGGFTLAFPDLALRSRDIEHIEICDSRIAPADLDIFLQVPKALKTFIYEVGETFGEPFEPPIVNLSYKSIADAMRHQKDSLESIWVDYPHDYQFNEAAAGEFTRPMGSFRDFTALRRFRIASTYLFGFVADTDPSRLVDSLPAQLEYLHLTHGDEDEELTSGLSMLLKTRAKDETRFAALKEISVDLCMPWLLQYGRLPHGDVERRNLDVFGALVRDAAAQGIMMRLWDNHSDTRVRRARKRTDYQRPVWKGPRREETPWGFDGEVKWAPRQTWCRERPRYEELRIDAEDNLTRMQDWGSVTLSRFALFR